MAFAVNIDDSVKINNNNMDFPPAYDNFSPTKYTPSNKDLTFINTSETQYDDGQSNSKYVLSESNNDTNFGLKMADPSSVRKRGAASNYLESKGFGWLLEVDDEEGLEQKPLLEELDIDLNDILYKLRSILFPLPQMGYNRKVVRDNPDFWGPLVVVLMYYLVSLRGQLSVVSWILTIWIFGSILIFLLVRVLGGEVNFSQCLGVIGYSLLPMSAIAIILPALHNSYFLSFFFKAIGVVWSTYSAGSLLCGQELQHKRPLLLYPILLLYIYFLSLYTGA